MLVERGLQVMNVEVVGDAYAIAANDPRRSGVIPDTLATNDRLLEIIVTMFQRGEFNPIRPRQQGDREIRSQRARLIETPRIGWNPPSTAS